MKNKNICKFDTAFQVEESKEKYVEDIRQMFFSFLKPILKTVPDFINKDLKADDVGTVFGKYFDKPGFVEEFENSMDKDFIGKLVDGSPFQHFCDDFFSEEFTNYKMFEGIMNPPTDEEKNKHQDKKHQEDASPIESNESKTPISTAPNKRGIKRQMTIYNEEVINKFLA